MKREVLIFIDNNRIIIDMVRSHFDGYSMKKLFFSAPEQFVLWKEKVNKVDYKCIIVSDYLMRNINGIQLLNRVKEKDAVKIIFSSVLESEDVGRAMTNHKIDAFFRKGYEDSLDKLEDFIVQSMS